MVATAVELQIPFPRVNNVVRYASTGDVLYKFTRIKQVKAYAITSETGASVELRLEFCRPTQEGDVFIANTHAEDQKRQRALERAAREAAAPPLDFGSAVRFKEPNKLRGGVDRRGVFVVANKTQAGWWLVRLGGGNGLSYIRGVDASALVLEDAINEVDWSDK